MEEVLPGRVHQSISRVDGLVCSLQRLLRFRVRSYSSIFDTLTVLVCWTSKCRYFFFCVILLRLCCPVISHDLLGISKVTVSATLQVVETRLFSEGLHTLGQPPSPEHMRQYLEAYFGDDVSPEAVDLVSAANGESLDAIKAKLQRIYSQVGTQTLSCSGSAHRLITQTLSCSGSTHRFVTQQFLGGCFTV